MCDVAWFIPIPPFHSWILLFTTPGHNQLFTEKLSHLSPILIYSVVLFSLSVVSHLYLSLRDQKPVSTLSAAYVTQVYFLLVFLFNLLVAVFYCPFLSFLVQLRLIRFVIKSFVFLRLHSLPRLPSQVSNSLRRLSVWSTVQLCFSLSSLLLHLLNRIILRPCAVVCVFFHCVWTPSGRTSPTRKCGPVWNPVFSNGRIDLSPFLHSFPSSSPFHLSLHHSIVLSIVWVPLVCAHWSTPLSAPLQMGALRCRQQIFNLQRAHSWRSLFLREMSFSAKSTGTAICLAS